MNPVLDKMRHVMPKAVLPTVVFAVAVAVGAASAQGRDRVWSCPQLHEAAFLDEPEEVRQVLAHGIDVNCTDVLGHTALVTAVNGASVHAFDILMLSGAQVNVRTEFGQSLLQMTRNKFSSVDRQKGMEQYRDLYKTMIAQLLSAGATQ